MVESVGECVGDLFWQKRVSVLGGWVLGSMLGSIVGLELKDDYKMTIREEVSSDDE